MTTKWAKKNMPEKSRSDPNKLPSAKWLVRSQTAAQLGKHTLSDVELTRAKEAFFNADTDGSGSIDREELAEMIKGLGQSPTKELVDSIMREADGSTGDHGNGKIELREFLAWYARMLKTNRDSDPAKESLVEDVYRALGGSPPPRMKGARRERGEEGPAEKRPVTKEEFAAVLKREYGLDVDIDAVFGLHPGGQLTMSDVEELLLGK